jgi:hypothetical protein
MDIGRIKGLLPSLHLPMSYHRDLSGVFLGVEQGDMHRLNLIG